MATKGGRVDITTRPPEGFTIPLTLADPIP